MSKIIPNKPLLVILYGYPGSGKTHFARQLSEQLQAVHIESGRIRHELFTESRYDKSENEVVNHIMDYMAEQFLAAGVSVIYDENSMRTAQRRVLVSGAKKAKVQPLLVWVQIDIESAFGRVAGRDRRRNEDKYAMTLDRTTFDKLTSNMQNPSREENYIVISGKHSFKTQLATVIKRLHDIGLITPEEASGKVIKPGLVNLIPNPAAGRVDLSRRNIVIR